MGRQIVTARQEVNENLIDSMMDSFFSNCVNLWKEIRVFSVSLTFGFVCVSDCFSTSFVSMLGSSLKCIVVQARPVVCATQDARKLYGTMVEDIASRSRRHSDFLVQAKAKMNGIKDKLKENKDIKAKNKEYLRVIQKQQAHLCRCVRMRTDELVDFGSRFCFGGAFVFFMS